MFPESFVKNRVAFSSMMHTNKYIHTDRNGVGDTFLRSRDHKMNISNDITHFFLRSLYFVYTVVYYVGNEMGIFRVNRPTGRMSRGRLSLSLSLFHSSMNYNA